MNIKDVTAGTRFTVQAVSGVIQPNEGQTNSRGEPKAPDVVITMRVVEGPEAGFEIFKYGSLHENSQQYTIEMLRTLGWTCNDITALTGLGTTKAIAVAKWEEYKGKRKLDWMVFPVKTPKPTLEADAAAGFAARFKALAASVAPIERTPLNTGVPLEQLPAAKVRSTNGAPTTGGPGAGGVPF